MQNLIEPLIATWAIIFATLEERADKVKRCCLVDQLHLTREREGMFAKMNKQLLATPAKFKNVVRMSPNQFDHLAELVSPLITKKTLIIENPSDQMSD